jgi:hypothetical protein
MRHATTIPENLPLPTSQDVLAEILHRNSALAEFPLHFAAVCRVIKELSCQDYPPRRRP